MIVRPERQDDRLISVEVERAAFGRALEADIVEAVRDEPGSFALVADDDGAVIGHVQMSRAWVGDDEVLALGPIGVAPDHQGTASVARWSWRRSRRAAGGTRLRSSCSDRPTITGALASNPARRSVSRTRSQARTRRGS